MEPDPPKPGKRNLKSRQQPDLLTIEGTEGLVVSYAKCCYPIPDDRIIGTTTADRGLVIHRLRCPNSKGIMKHQDQFFHLNWANDTRGVFQVMLKLETLDQPGVLSEITNTIAVHESNINKLSVEEQAGNVSRMSFVIEVKDRKHLADIMRDLHIKPAVAKINRPR